LNIRYYFAVTVDGVFLRRRRSRSSFKNSSCSHSFQTTVGERSNDRRRGGGQGLEQFGDSW